MSTQPYRPKRRKAERPLWVRAAEVGWTAEDERELERFRLGEALVQVETHQARTQTY